MSNALKMNVVQLIVMKFIDNEVIDAKDIMCKNSDNILYILQYQIRKDSQYRSEKFVHPADIYEGIKKLSDVIKMPLYVTDGFGLSRLPKLMLRISQIYQLLKKWHLLNENLQHLMTLRLLSCFDR